MKIITINVNEKQVELMKKFTDKGIYPSRSEMIRIAIRDFLIKEAKLYKVFIEPILKSDDVNTIKIPMGKGKYKYLTRIGEA